MSTPINDGGPAFPLAAHTGHACDDNRGMYLRDWFAGQALAGWMANKNLVVIGGNDAEYAKQAYAIADAMLAERAKRNTP